MVRLVFVEYFRINFSKMKSEDLQKVVLFKHGNGQSKERIFQFLKDFVSSRTIRPWCKMIKMTGTIDLSRSPDRPSLWSF
jgi:hypothetical protein